MAGPPATTCRRRWRPPSEPASRPGRRRRRSCAPWPRRIGSSCGPLTRPPPGSLSGGPMVRRAYHQRSLVEVLLPDAAKLWDDELRAIDAVLRMLVLKHLYDWSFAECEREVRRSLVYRAFCRIDGERVPDAKTLVRLTAVLGPATLTGIVERLVHLARARRVVRGHRLRVDTTVVETTIHHPTDSSLLADGVRVLTRTMHRIRAEV